MKPALYYTLRRAYAWAIGYEIIAVTSENRGRVNGRRLDEDRGKVGIVAGYPMHMRSADRIGHFPTEQAARNAIQGVVDIRAKYKPDIDVADETASKLRRRCEMDIAEFLKRRNDNAND